MLLDDSDQNIGNIKVVSAYPDPITTVPVFIPKPDPDRILFLDAVSPSGMAMTVGLAATPVLRPGAPITSSPPFITAIVEFGNGSTFTRIEVDVQAGTIQSINNILQEPIDGVVLVTIPSGTLRVYARNDAKLIVPNLLGGTPTLGVGATLAPPSAANTLDAAVKAFTCYYSVQHIKPPTKTQYIGGVSGGTLTFADTIGESYPIPPLAKRFRVFRTGLPAVAITTYDARFGIVETYTIAAGTPSPIFELSAIENRISIGTVLAAGNRAMLSYEIGA